MPMNAWDILNTVRSLAGQDYQNRVPTATQENIADTGNAITEYEPIYNEFMSVLLNKIVLQIVNKIAYKNPFGEFKRGTLPTGATIEETFIDLARAIDLNMESDDSVWKRTIPDVSAIYHTINRDAEAYPQTVHLVDLQRAFLSQNGLNDFVNQIVQSIYNADEKDEFEIMKAQLSEYYKKRYFYPVYVPAPVDERTAKDAMIMMRKTSNDLIFLKNKFNSMGVHTTTPKTDQIIFLRTDFDAITDVDVLAKAFNMDKTNFLARTILVDDFGDGTEDVVAMMVDKRFYVQYDTTYRMEQLWNPKKLYWNYWLHHYGIYSVSRFANAIAFIAAPVSVTGVTLTPSSASVMVGNRISLKHEVTGNADSYIPQQVNWEINGTVTDSYIDKSGVLHVGTAEMASTIQVIATSTYNENVFGVSNITVVPRPVPTVVDITIDPVAVALNKGDTQQFTYVITGINGLTDKRAVFSMSGGATDSRLTSNGELSIGANETAATLNVVVTSVYDNTKQATAVVTVNP